jgi:hypothetical protein
MTNQSSQAVVIVSVLSAVVITLAAISSNEVEYVTYASKEILNCPKNNSVNQPTVQSASQVAIGNNIQQIIIQNGDQKGIAGNNNNNCKHDHYGGVNSHSHHNFNDNNNHDQTNDNNNNQSLVQNAEQNAVGDNNNQYLVQNSNQASYSGNLNQWIEHLKEKILSHVFDNMN